MSDRCLYVRHGADRCVLPGLLARLVGGVRTDGMAACGCGRIWRWQRPRHHLRRRWTLALQVSYL